MQSSQANRWGFQLASDDGAAKERSDFRQQPPGPRAARAAPPRPGSLSTKQPATTTTSPPQPTPTRASAAAVAAAQQVLRHQHSANDRPRGSTRQPREVKPRPDSGAGAQGGPPSSGPPVPMLQTRRRSSVGRLASATGGGRSSDAAAAARLAGPATSARLRAAIAASASSNDGTPPPERRSGFDAAALGLRSASAHPDVAGAVTSWHAEPAAAPAEFTEGAYVFLATSPFPMRNSTLVFHPLDSDTVTRQGRVVPVPMQPHITAAAVEETLRLSPWAVAQPLPPSGFARVKRVGRKGAKYGGMMVCMPDRAVRFSGIMHAFGGAGLSETGAVDDPAWVLRWAKRVDMEEYGMMRPYQKINHFPGTWGIGRKDNLHRRMQELSRRHGAEHYPFVPGGFVLPRDYGRLVADFQARTAQLKAARARAVIEKGPGAADLMRKRPLYIRKQVASACGRGMYVITKPPRSRHAKALIQEYIDNPLLVNGRKFDLRIYVVVTSFNPLRVYVYREGLARFALTPYPTGADAIAKCKTAHLTNYSISVQHAEFKKPVLQTALKPTVPTAAAGGPSAPPRMEASSAKDHPVEGDVEEDSATDPAGDADDDDDAEDGDVEGESTATGDDADAATDNGDGNDDDGDDDDDNDDAGTKLTFEMLREQFVANGWDWDGLWRRVDDTIIKTLLAVEPDVSELVHKSYRDSNNTKTGGAPGCDGAGNNFELFGFDVLPRSDGTVALMEANIMPSLSTSGSVLDQHVKANMIGEMLTLVGVQGTGQRPSKATGSTALTGDEFLDSLPPAVAPIVKATEEEFLRRGHFRRIFPTPSSYDAYKPFFKEPRPLNAMLQQWEARKAANLVSPDFIRRLNPKYHGKRYVFDGTGKSEAAAADGDEDA